MSVKNESIRSDLLFQICSDLMDFQTTQLKSDAEPIPIAVPKCLFTKYKSGMNDAADDNASPEPPESILVLQDMRPLGFNVSHSHT